METIEVRVKYCYGTFIARAKGKAASCTTGERQAVESLAVKLGAPGANVNEDPDRRGIWLVGSKP